MAEQSSSEYSNAIIASFDKSLRTFRFSRTVPVAIYVDAGDESRSIGRRYAEVIDRVFAELEFSVTVLGVEDGSFCQLNICESKVPLDEPSLMERLRHAAERIHNLLADSPIPKLARASGSAATILVAIGNFVQFAHGGHNQDIVIGHFTIPTPVWTVILATKGSKSFLKDCRELFIDSKAFVKALRESRKKLKEGKKGFSPMSGLQN